MLADYCGVGSQWLEAARHHVASGHEPRGMMKKMRQYSIFDEEPETHEFK
ncbi:unnamed protein product [Mycetohabitans rhizoxinica HKI 454]|uniref:Uncharacterized protein n=1 Tax=Mycetohabitans rhizoxinica (strain DSM 19002 / CIP 109453 / HKI 454) TaxID=882378 RepID=E5AQV1_MYCRK|nr:unnamed protein product [Mycetohabitans rhizoxinica HKI 454]